MFFFPLFRRPSCATHLEIGASGEATAAQHLTRRGYEIVRRNLRVGRKDEVDILAYDPEEEIYVFVEVKTRAREDPDYAPEINATRRKRTHMARAARRWMDTFAADIGYRLDLVCVADGRVAQHYEDIEH